MTAPFNFLGLPEKLCAYEQARAVVLPVPYEHTVSYGAGTALGPHAIIEASTQVELYDEELRCEPCEIGVATLPALKVDGLAPRDMATHVSAAMTAILKDRKLPVIFGGEHSITPPAVKAVAAAFPNLTVVQFDAHADLRQEYEGEPMSHACAMARVREICPAVQVGIRNLSIDEAQWVERDRLAVFFAKDQRLGPHWMKAALDAITTEDIYISIDLDCFDSSIMPATGTPEPGGMTWYEVTDFLRLIIQQKRVVGIDVVELAPKPNLHACDFLAAKLAYKCLGYWQSSRSFR